MGTKSLAIIALFVISFGFLTGIISHLNEEGSMTLCPFMHQGSACQMSIVEHISELRSLFLYVLQYSVIGFTFILSLFYFREKYGEKQISPAQFALFECGFLPTKLFDKLLAALSDGILQPKLYA